MGGAAIRPTARLVVNEPAHRRGVSSLVPNPAYGALAVLLGARASRAAIARRTAGDSVRSQVSISRAAMLAPLGLKWPSPVKCVSSGS